jgi:hypothetical protein
MLSSFTLQTPMKVANSATVSATHVLSRALRGLADTSDGPSASSIGSISMPAT